jgi:alpha-N-arabinofuranosidase
MIAQTKQGGDTAMQPVNLPLCARNNQGQGRAAWGMVGVAALALLGACATAPVEPAPAREARFDYFEYVGRDPVHEATPSSPDTFRNPILSGFYPDPSFMRVDEDYYLVTSTFSYFPGIPIFKSRDLVNWTQIGNVIDRPDMLDFGTLGMSRGVFAPSIAYNEGVFYVANTCVDCGGNFIVTATDPAGPWSDPIWTPHVGGIDPSLFFDDDGKVYLMNNDAPVGEPRYSGHRAVWIREVHPQTFEALSEPIVLIDGGVRPEENPIWIEGPNIYKIGDYYYLCAAEGGTAEGHSQVILRSRTALGPYEAYEHNPILTQRHLDRARLNPITSTGHADFLQTQNGEWWVTFLGVRPYEGDTYNTGRETFLMPVRWRDGWPIITEGQEAVPFAFPRPNLPADTAPVPMSGNFTVREEFNEARLAPHWLFMRNLRQPWFSLEDGALVIQPRPEHIGGFTQPSFVGRRQQHTYATASTAMHFTPGLDGEEAGLVAIQNDEFYFFFGVRRENGQNVVQLRQRSGPDQPIDGLVLASAPLDFSADLPVHLRIEADAGKYSFSYGPNEADWRPLLRDADATMLSTRRAGGFVGAVIGMYAYAPE